MPRMRNEAPPHHMRGRRSPKSSWPESALVKKLVAVVVTTGTTELLLRSRALELQFTIKTFESTTSKSQRRRRTSHSTISLWHQMSVEANRKLRSCPATIEGVSGTEKRSLAKIEAPAAHTPAAVARIKPEAWTILQIVRSTQSKRKKERDLKNVE